MTFTEYMAGRQAVYVMKGWSSPDLYKIGCSADVARRYNSKRIQASIVHVFPVPDGMDIYTAENMVHRFFDSRNVNGHETFALTAGDLEVIGSIRFEDGRMLVGDQIL